MRRREHERILSIVQEAHQQHVQRLLDQIGFLEAQNKDLLNRAMAQDWTAYTALSAEPVIQEPLPDRIYDPTGLIEVFDESDE